MLTRGRKRKKEDEAGREGKLETRGGRRRLKID